MAALAIALVILVIGISSMVKYGVFNLPLVLLVCGAAILSYRLQLRRMVAAQKLPSVQAAATMQLRMEEYGPSPGHERAGNFIVVAALVAEVAAYLVYGTRAASLAPLTLFLPVCVAIGASAPKHRLDVAQVGIGTLLKIAIATTAMAFAAFFLPDEKPEFSLLFGFLAWLASLFIAQLAIGFIRGRRARLIGADHA